MKYTIFYTLITFALLFTNVPGFGQEQDAAYIIHLDKLSEQELKGLEHRLPADGWVLLIDEDKNMIVNCSNKDYRLSLALTCKESGAQPYYFIEYSDRYRDGDWDGIDFANSVKSDFADMKIILDGKTFDNPFAPKYKSVFGQFAAALKVAKKMTMVFYDSGMNPETGVDELKINRSIEFKTARGLLLDKAVNCKPLL